MQARLLQTIFISPQKLVAWNYGIRETFSYSQTVAQVVKKHSGTTDPVYIVGSEPQILYYAKRQSATRFVILYPLAVKSPYQQTYEKEAFDNLVNHKPRIVIQVDSPDSWSVDGKKPSVQFSQKVQALLVKEYSLIHTECGGDCNKNAYNMLIYKHLNK